MKKVEKVLSRGLEKFQKFLGSIYGQFVFMMMLGWIVMDLLNLLFNIK